MTTNSTNKLTLRIAALALTLGLGLAAAPAALLAQQGPRVGGDYRGHGGHGRAHQERTPAERLAHWQQKFARVSEQLQLTPRQNAEAQRILQDTLARAEQMRAGTAERSPERRAARHALFEQANTRFSAILNAQQRTQWETIKTAMRERRGRGHHGRRGDGAPRGQRTEAERGI